MGFPICPAPRPRCLQNPTQYSRKAEGQSPGRPKVERGLDQNVQLSEFLLCGRKWPLAFPKDGGSPWHASQFWFPRMCPSYSIFFSLLILGRTRASSAAASSPSRFQDSLQGRGPKVSGRKTGRSRGRDTVASAERWGPRRLPWRCEKGHLIGCLCTRPEDFSGWR